MIKPAKISYISNYQIYDDNLVTYENRFPSDPLLFNNFESILASQRNNMVRIEYKCKFFEALMTSYLNNRWVDIEYAYFESLLGYYKLSEKSGEKLEIQVQRLNKCLENITILLIEYLKTLRFLGQNDIIKNSLWGAINYPEFKNARFLVFNYTDTMEYYLSHLEQKRDSVIYIHGSLKDRVDRIVFGFGDEINPYYQKIEDLNVNEYLKRMKSFGYLKSTAYQRLFSFLDSDEFKVCILGHSCGMSDRVLLNSIFCHDNCQEIQVYYHQIDPDTTDFENKTMEISRHFKPSDKASMRKKIVCFEKSQSLS